LNRPVRYPALNVMYLHSEHKGKNRRERTCAFGGTVAWCAKMKLPKLLLQGIDGFLSALPPKVVKRGRDDFACGAVVELECVEPNQRYQALVRADADYEVSLEWMQFCWVSECSCARAGECRHAVAAALQLRYQAGSNGGLPALEGARWAQAGPAPRTAQSKPVQQPPASPLSEKLTENLGRPLRFQEGRFIRQIQALYALARSRPLTEADLVPLVPHALGAFAYDYWKPVELWPELPGDDFYFWLHVAWELRRRALRWPEFMKGITELALIERAMRAWERAKEIEQWKGWFRQYEVRPPAADPGRLELRLAILAQEARLQWRVGADAAFADLKQVQAKRLAEQFESSVLAIAPESLSLWGAAYKPWSYQSWWAFKYDDQMARPALNRLLRLPLRSEQVVTSSGQPLARVGEPLRLELQPPQNGEEHYQLALVTASGAPPPPLLGVFQGQPTLYLTADQLFSGPPGEALERATRQSIPAAALETSEGVRFLHATGVPLPAHLQARLRTVPVRVKIDCRLKAPYADSASEDLVVGVIAAAPGMPQEQLTARGWESNSSRKPPKTSASEASAITVFERQAQQLFPRLLEPLGLKWDDYFGVWRVRVTKKLPETLVPWLQSLPPEVELTLDAELATLRDEPVSGSVSLDVAEAGIDWFDVKVALQVTDTTLTPEELKLLLGAHGRYVRLGKKGWRRLQFNLSPEEDEQLAQLGLNPRDFSAEPQRFHALQLADEAARRFLGPDRVELIHRRVRDLKARVAPELPGSIRAELRPYQTEGFHFLSYLAANRFGGVLADDMGLGKTLQTLAWLAWLRDEPSQAQSLKSEVQSPASQTTEEGNGGCSISPNGSQPTPHVSRTASDAPSTNPLIHPSTPPAPAPALAPPLPALVVCPKSVMENWRAEAQRFYPELRVRLWQGESASELASAREAADLLVLNYAQLRSLSAELAALNWLAVILDEAQCIKNPDCQTAQAARALKAEHRLALTGTPIENRLLDLWSLMGFAMPGALGNRTHFLRRFDAKDDPLARRRLAARVRPFLLRRTKAQVAQDLPDRVEEDWFCDMEGRQKALYQAELKRARQLILGLTTHQQFNRERFNILTSLLRLRQICCHPALVDDSLRRAESAKLAALEELLEPLMEEGHKVLVFSQFVTLLELVREKVIGRGWAHFYLSGDTENRGELVRNFQTAEGGAVFLLSLKAGGFGLNLTAASYVVLFDPWWNPAVENQAIDRTHRIGQTSKVMAYRLLMRESIEQKIRLLQKQKAALVEDVLGEERFAQILTLEDLRVLFAE
jgi:superfamily II DNA or RNA helicase